MAEAARGWVKWALGGGVVLVLLCVATGVAAAKFGPLAMRAMSSTPLPSDGVVSTDAWALTLPSSKWRRLTPRALATMPVKKEAAFLHMATGGLLAIDGVTSKTSQWEASKFAEAMVEQERKSSTDLEVLDSSTFSTCGVDAELRELRLTRQGKRYVFLHASYVGYHRVYDVSAWVEEKDFAASSDELRAAVKGFCPIDSPFLREWLRNFIASYTDEKLHPSMQSGDGEGSAEVTTRMLVLHYSGIQRLSRRELVRAAELMLAMTDDAEPEVCAGVWRWDLVHIENRLATLPVEQMREWYRIGRHAQRASVDDAWDDEMASFEAIGAALDAPLPTQALTDAREVALQLQPLTDLCGAARAVTKYALSLPPDERDAMLRALASTDD